MPNNQIIQGDCRAVLKGLPADSVDLCVTSPPYWGLRLYRGLPDTDWGDGSVCQLGLEKSPELYIKHLVSIFHEVKRVLKPSGVCFVNLGDSYASGKGTCYNPGGGEHSLGGHKDLKENEAYPLDRGNKSTLEASKLKPKDLCLIPFRFVIAMQEAGWWVRSTIIWNKPNPMPESVKDRPTESHEYIFMFTKSARYFWNQEAVREPIAESTIGRGLVDFGGQKGRDYKPDTSDPNFRAGSEQWGRTFDYKKSCAFGRNLRSVWEFPTQPYPKAHFATFPEKLPELCIKAGCPEQVCSTCGKPWVNVVERYLPEFPKSVRAEPYSHGGKISCLNVSNSSNYRPVTNIIGTKPTCSCNADTLPGTVLDPFAGSGTVGEVAIKLGRRYILIEQSDEYINLIQDRVKQMGLL